ncbi:MAG: efflux RND transporter permease subunit, partial [Candidatus Nitrosoglobus sp.]
MKFTDLFIRRPVLASVVNLLILLIGLRALTLLELRQYPETLNTVVTVSTAYAGASSELINSFITTPLEQAIAEAKGIDYLIASSIEGHSSIEVHMNLNYDPNAAIAEIQAKAASQRNVLPKEAESPVIDSNTGETTDLIYMAFYSDEMSLYQITDYLLRAVQPKLQAVQGVAKAELIGDKSPAMRIWLDPRRMAALGVTAGDVRAVLLSNNYLAGVGRTKGRYISINLSTNANISQEKDFLNLVVYEKNGVIARIKDVAVSKLGVENYDSASWYRDRPAIYIGIQQAPGSNPLDIAEKVHALMPEIRSQLPSGLNGVIVSDYSVYVADSIQEVLHTLAEAVLIVLVVIFLFLGSLRAALIPAVAVPLSLIGAAFLMLLLGFSLNLLTLLAMVLAIGLVVDDAIIVVENIHRHLEMGKSHFQAAIHGARELGLPIIAMTTTLMAVYAPIGFMGGLVGTLFTEFAFTLACAVLISGVVALTLSPMLSSKILKPAGEGGRFEQFVERSLMQLAGYYQRLLHRFLDNLLAIIVFAGVMLGSIYFMYISSQNELAPTEDISILLFQATGPETASINYGETYSHQIVDIFKTFPEYDGNWLMIGLGSDINTVRGGFRMVAPTQRERSQMEIQPELQQKLQAVAGFEISVFPRPSLPGVGGLPVQFVITTDSNVLRLDQVASDLIERAMGSGKFAFLQKSVKFEQPRVTLKINRDLAGDLGIRMEDIGNDLAIMLGGNYINWFDLEGRSYKVIPQVAHRYRLNQQMLENYYTRTGTGKLIPIGTLVSFEETIGPSNRTQFQRLNALIVQGVMATGVTLGEALAYLETQAREIFPSGFGWDYAGESRQYVQQGSALAITFFFALLVIYLVLAAQFESWRDPVIILMSVPMSIAGALVFLTLGFATINIYAQVGLITLIGLIAKNGILIVEFANQLQIQEGLGKREAVEKA